MRNDLTRSANGLYMSLVAVRERVHLISFPSLSSFSGKARRDCFDSDGLHTNGKGSANLCFDLISGVKSVFTDIATKKPNTNESIKLKGGDDLKDGQRDVRVNKGQGAGGRSHRHSRGGQQWNGQPYQGGGGGYRGGWQQENQWIKSTNSYFCFLKQNELSHFQHIYPLFIIIFNFFNYTYT